MHFNQMAMEFFLLVLNSWGNPENMLKTTLLAEHANVAHSC